MENEYYLEENFLIMKNTDFAPQIQPHKFLKQEQVHQFLPS